MILVTGCSGYIGRHLVQKLLDDGFSVVGIDNTESDAKLLAIKPFKDISRFKYISGDIRNIESLEEVFHKYPISRVVHLAAVKSVPQCEGTPIDAISVNSGGTFNLLSTMAKFDVKNLVFASTGAVYEVDRYLPSSEHHSIMATERHGVYARSKILCETIMDKVVEDGTWNIISLRLFNVIGASTDGRHGHIGFLETEHDLQSALFKAKRGTTDTITVFGPVGPGKDIGCSRSYIDINDVVEAFDVAIRLTATCKLTSHLKYNVCNKGHCATSVVIETLESVSGNKIEMLHDSRNHRRGNEPNVSMGFNHKLIEETLWTPKYTLEDSLRNQLNFVLGHKGIKGDKGTK